MTNFPDAHELAAAGYRLVPLTDGGFGTLRVAAVLRAGAGANRPEEFVTIRDFFSGRAVLGALIDAGDALQEWLELWVQILGPLADCPNPSVQRSNNLEWDRRWTQFFSAAKKGGEPRPVEMGFESTHPLPLYYHPRTGRIGPPLDPVSGRPWELVVEDAVLDQRGLPRYSESLQRYFWLRDAPERPFTTAGPSDLVPEGAISWTEAVRDADALVPLNPEGGLMQVHRLARLSLDSWINLVNGERDEREIRDELTEIPGLSLRPGEVPGGLSLFLSERNALHSRYLETLHAKLALFHGLLNEVYWATRRTKQPFLNLGASSFRVAVTEGAQGLPWTWACRPRLVRPSGAAFVSMGDGRRQIPVPLGIEGRDAAYMPENIAVDRPEGRGDIKLTSQRIEGDTVEMKLVLRTSSDLCDVVAGDFCLFTLKVGGKRVWFNGIVSKCTPNPVRGQLEIESMPQRLELVQVAALGRQGTNMFLAETFQVYPNLGSPCDLHSMGVLLVRLLFGNQSRDYRDAVRDVYQLAGRLSVLERDLEGDELPRAVLEILQASGGSEEVAWRARLQASALLPVSENPVPGPAPVPNWLWAECLAFLVRLFPRQGPFSWCADYSGPAADELSGIFEEPIATLQGLLERARSLLLSDLRHEVEVGALVRDAHRHSLKTG